MEMKDLLAAADLHRPIMYDRWGQVTTDPATASTKYGPLCNECMTPVRTEGCRTWRVANGVAK
jgi:hypothetical protein